MRLPYDRSVAMGKLTRSRLDVRLPIDVLALLTRAAEIRGCTLSEFVICSAQDAAHRAIQEAEVVRLALEDQPCPSRPTPTLLRAVRRHRELVGSSLK